MPLIQIAIAFVQAVRAIVESHRSAAEENRVAAGLLIFIEFVGPGVRDCALERIGETLHQLHGQRIVPLLAAIFDLVDVAISRVDTVAEQIDRRAINLRPSAGSWN